MTLTLTRRQQAFVAAKEFEVLYGGAAGGGKSYGQLSDALLYATTYAGSKQLILRRTYGELEKTLIRQALDLYPREIFKFESSRHCGRFANGSLIDFGSLDAPNDIYKYQSAEYDVIRFDELTHFTEDMYRYLISRVRGANEFPKSVKSTTNPGGLGHSWVKSRFIDPAPPDTAFTVGGLSRIFLPARLCDNPHLERADPDYRRRLELLGERERKALLDGCWDLFEGQYFSEFDREVHVVEPFALPRHWPRYRAIDYGLDMLACLFLAVDEQGRAWVYREVYQSGLIVSQAAEAIRAATHEPITATFAPPDLWNRHKDTGRSTAEIFHNSGIPLRKVSNDRIQGWLELKEWLRPYTDEQGQRAAALRIFTTCRNLIRTLPALAMSEHDPGDAATTPHELTHAPDALRYFTAGRPRPAHLSKPEPIPFFSVAQKKGELGQGERVRVI